MKSSYCYFATGGLLLVAVAGCQQAEPAQIAPPKVKVALPIQKDVTDYVEFTGTLQPVDSTQVEARVQGFLQKVHFEDGANVKEGDLLFTIEPEPFEAEVEIAKARVEEAQAKAALAEANFSRAERLLKQKAMAREEFQTKQAEREVANSAVLAAKADLRQKKISLSYTQVHAPISGMVGRHLIDQGNLVGTPTSSLLTTIVSMDPIYVTFDVREPILLQYLQTQKENEKTDPDYQREVRIGLSTEEGFPHTGTIDFVDNTVDTSTGTVLVRAVVENDDHLLYPGAFVRIQIPKDLQEDALLIQEQALGTDLGGKFVYIVNEDNTVRQQHLELGSQIGSQRIVLSGLKPTDRYIVEGVQRARPGMPVQVEMGSAESDVEDEPEASPKASPKASPENAVNE